jgi:putative oxidoreductase
MSADLSAEIVFTGRLLLGGAFVFAGIRNIFNASLLTQLMSTRGVPWAQEVLWLGIVLQIATGALLIAGIWTGFAAAGLILFLLAATPMFHDFWNHQGPERAAKINGVVGNAALVGGFLVVMAGASQ